MDFKLIYINRLGTNYKGDTSYEFIFCNDSIDLDDVWGDNWEISPADGYSYPPDEQCIHKVGLIKCRDYNLEVAHESQYFSLADAKDNIIPLGYEIIDEDFNNFPRLVFHFGESIKAIEDKLKLRKIKMEYEA